MARGKRWLATARSIPIPKPFETRCSLTIRSLILPIWSRCATRWFAATRWALATVGLAGLLPAQRGPKAAHKLSTEILTFDADLRSKNPEISMSQRLDAIEGQFGVKIHRRSLERALARKKK